MTTALVTGAGGFVARHLVPALRTKGFTRVIGADIRAVRPDLYDATFVADLSIKSEMLRVLKGSAPTTVFHLPGLAQASEEDIFASNVDTADHLIQGVGEALPLTRIVLIGSAAEYGDVPLDRQPVDENVVGNPRSPYGRAKAALTALASRAAGEKGIHVVVARPFNIVGPGIPSSLVVGAIVDRLRRAISGAPPRAIRVGTTTSIRDFVAVEDVVEGLILASERGKSGAVYNLCTGIGRSIGEVLQKLVSLIGQEIEVEPDPSLVREGETNALVGCWQKAKRELGWSPRVTFDTSLQETWAASAATFASSTR
jgi:GDP-4-dehydro-6-deoxy-D-mannose reductase